MTDKQKIILFTAILGCVVAFIVGFCTRQEELTERSVPHDTEL